ncbi:ATP-binding protein [Streptomyces sp. NPDC006879]|uniref:ATP-binding protein n=1 Tax=Streptomyces sp. NPDC006879 TaxID=3364767 RepID=UPI003699CD99
MIRESALPSQPHAFEVRLSATPRGARLARLLSVEQLRSWSLGFVSDPAAQIVAELATNAVTHGRVPGRDFRLALAASSTTLRIEVTDTRVDLLPALLASTARTETGRGLHLVAALADSWGVTEGPPPRKTVWAQLFLEAT